MILTAVEKEAIINLGIQDDELKIEDETRSGYQYEIFRLTKDEWRVTQWSSEICLQSDHFFSPTEVIEFLMKQ